MQRLVILLGFLLYCVGGQTQNLEIQGKARIHSSDTGAVLSLQGEGLVLPRLTIRQRDSMSNPQLGMIIFNTTTNCIEIYVQGWHSLCTSRYETQPLNRLLGGSGQELLYCIFQTSDGGYIAAGHSTSSDTGDVSGINNGSDDYWIVKLNGGGVIQWETLLGGSENDIARSIYQTEDGGYVVGGSSRSPLSGDVTSMNNGSWDYWIVKLNSGGGIEWDTLLGGDEPDVARSIIQTSDGGYIVGGSSSSSDTGNVSGINNGGSDYWIVKLNSGGGIEWDTLLGGNGADVAYSLAQTSDNGYIVGGYSTSSMSGDVSGTTNGGEDYWIVKLNNGGGIEWDTLLGGGGPDLARSISQTTDGGYIVGGNSESSDSGDVSGINNGGSDYWIVKLNSGGGIEWDSLLGGSGFEDAESISQTMDGGYIVGGSSSSSASGDVSEMNQGSDNNDYWIVKLNSSGGIEWETLHGGTGNDLAQSISQTSDGGFIVGGYSPSSASGDVLDMNNGGHDYWIITLSPFGVLLK